MTSWRASYLPGSWVVLTGADVLVALRPEAVKHPEQLERALQDVVSVNSFSEITRRMIGWGAGLEADLVVFVEEDRVRAVVRDELILRDGETGAIVGDGGGSPSWKTMVRATQRIRVDLEALAEAPDWISLPEGVSYAASIALDARQGSEWFIGSSGLAPEGAAAETPKKDYLAEGSWVVDEYGIPLRENEYLNTNTGKPWVAPYPQPQTGPLNPQPEEYALPDPPVVETPTVDALWSAYPQISDPLFDSVPENEAEVPSDRELFSGTNYPEMQSQPIQESPLSPEIDPQLWAAATGQAEWPGAEEEIPQGNYDIDPSILADLDALIEDLATDKNAELSSSWMTFQPPADAGVIEIPEPAPLAEPEPEPLYQPEPEPEPIVEPEPEPLALSEQETEQYIPPAQDAAWYDDDDEPAAPTSEAFEVANPDYLRDADSDSLNNSTWSETPPTVAEPEPVSAPEPESEPEPEPEPEEAPLGLSTVFGADEPEEEAAPIPVLVFSDGREVTLDKPVIVGRAPKKTGNEDVELIKVASPNHDVSRSHVRIEPRGSGFLILDLNSTNGTMVRLPDEPSMIVTDGNPVLAKPGALISLGDGVVLRIDES
jgi:hypothetical protein